VPITRAQLGNADLFDISSVEVLRGPQGMLFGKNASAGLINVSTNRPQLGGFEGSIQTQFSLMDGTPGTGARPRINGMLNVPLGDKAAFRVTGFYRHDDPLSENVMFNHDYGVESWGTRAKLLWAPSNNFEFLLSGDYVEYDGAGEAVYLQSSNQNGGVFQGLGFAAGVVATPENLQTANDKATSSKSKIRGVSARGELELSGGYTLTGVTAFRKTDQRFRNDIDSTQLNGLDINTHRQWRQFSGELRLASPADGKISYQVGLFYLDLNTHEENLISGNLFQPLAPVPGLVANAGDLSIIDYANESVAAFFEGQVKFSERLSLSLGGRYTHDSLDYTYDSDTAPGSLFGVLSTGVPKTNSDSRSNVSYRGSLNFNLNDDILVYASYGRGYKGAGFDALTARLVNPEIPTSYELGVKTKLFDNALRLNVALFDMSFNNFQTQAYNGLSIIAINAGKLQSRGVEVEASLFPVNGLTITSALTYNDTAYKGLAGLPCYIGQPTGTSGTNVCLPPSLTAPRGSVDVSGNQLAQAPRWTGSVMARYDFPIGSEWNAFVQGDAYFRSSYNFAAVQDPRTAADGITILGASFGIRTNNDRISITLFGRNLTDERYPVSLIANPVAGFLPEADYFQQFTAESFRQFGVNVGFKF
jgi:iron complex outermembrane recepter protein